MSESIKSLIESGTRLWLDSIDPELIVENREWGATGATSNPIIVADLIKSGRFDEWLQEFSSEDVSDEDVAWKMTHRLVADAQASFRDVYDSTEGNDGYVSFELDPLLEDPELNLPHDQRVQQYKQLARTWSANQPNRMIKVPATPAGLDALEDIAAAGVPLNVTLIFDMDQYRAARDAVWRGIQRLADPSGYKSVYSIFVSRIDVYTQKHCPELPAAAQGQVGIVNAKRIWADNVGFWKDKGLKLDQEIIFASTGTKNPNDPPWKYVQALAGSDIQTNPPATNQAVAESGLTFSRTVDQMPPAEILEAIDQYVDFPHMFETLMSEGIAKFANPHKDLIELIRSRRETLAAR